MRSMTANLKSSLHQLIEDIENEQLLTTLRDFLLLQKTTPEGKLWRELPNETKADIFLSLEESKDPANLVSRKEFLNPKK